jgi:hypothetical protein
VILLLLDFDLQILDNLPLLNCKGSKFLRSRNGGISTIFAGDEPFYLRSNGGIDGYLLGCRAKGPYRGDDGILSLEGAGQRWKVGIFDLVYRDGGVKDGFG